MKTATGKEKLFAMLLCFALALPIAPVGAQDADDAEAPATEAVVPKAAEPKTAPKPSGQPNINLKMPKIQGAKTVTAVINTVIGYIAKIGGIFGKSAGTRIGGTSVSAIAMLVIAKLVEDKAPDWVKWMLYLSGGTMAVGSGANITKLIMGLIN